MNKSVKILLVLFVTALLFSLVHCCVSDKNDNIQCSNDETLEQTSLESITRKDLSTAVIIGSSLSTIAPNAFEDFANVMMLKLQLADKKVLNLQPESFNGLSKLIVLIIRPGIVALEENLFTSISKTLAILDLSINGSNPKLSNGLSILARLRDLTIRDTILNEINDQTFLNISTKIEILKLWNNSLAIIKPKAFSPLKNLKKLIINKNNLVTLSNNIFSQMQNILSISLAENKISSIESGVFSNCFLTKLDLSYNKLEKIEKNWFTNFTVNTLYLQGNKINYIHRDAFNGSRIIGVTYLSKNANLTINEEYQQFIPSKRLKYSSW